MVPKVTVKYFISNQRKTPNVTVTV